VPAKPPSLRITTTPWFTSEHRELARSDLERAGARSYSDCGACHADGAAGRFEERAPRRPFEEDGDE
jgi:nitrate/TMAO reductase-like tetraheme cytochrome c subunit